MLVIIFGAGASYDSSRLNLPPADGSRTGNRPPLASHLFEPSMQSALDQYRQAAGLISIVRDAVLKGSNVEAVLEDLQDQAGDVDDRRHVELLAVRFFLRDAIERCVSSWEQGHRGVTNYAELLTRVRNWQRHSDTPVRLVTFNYDTLIDSACRDVLGMDLRSMGGFVDRDDTRLYKVHGSTSWVQAIRNSFEERSNVHSVIIELGSRIDLEPDGFVVDTKLRVRLSDDTEQKWAVPAIALPLVTKSGFVCPPNHTERMLSDLAEAERILIVGWSGGDEHFKRAWSEAAGNRAPPVYISDRDTATAASVGDRIAAFVRLASIRPLDVGFTGLLEGDTLERLLHE